MLKLSSLSQHPPQLPRSGEVRYICDYTGQGDDCVYCKAVGVSNDRCRSFFRPEGLAADN